MQKTVFRFFIDTPGAFLNTKPYSITWRWNQETVAGNSKFYFILTVSSGKFSTNSCIWTHHCGKQKQGWWRPFFIWFCPVKREGLSPFVMLFYIVCSPQQQCPRYYHPCLVVFTSWSPCHRAPLAWFSEDCATLPSVQIVTSPKK